MSKHDPHKASAASADAQSIIERAAALYARVERSEPLPPRELRLPEAEPEQASDPAIGLTTPVRQRLSADVDEGQPSLQPVTQEPPTAIAKIDAARLHQAGFMVPGGLPTPLSEAFRVAKRHLMLGAFGGHATNPVERGRAIVVSSAHPNEGKTFCSINLALSLSGESDLEVLLIDADSIKPEVLSSLAISGGHGLMDALAAGVEPERFIVPTTVRNFFILPAGQRIHNDTELLGSRQMQEFVQRYLAGSPNRIILFDSAPVLAASSAPVLAAHVGQVVIVVRADETHDVDLAEAVRLFAGVSKVQLLLNRTSFARSTQNYGAYYGHGG